MKKAIRVIAALLMSFLVVLPFQYAFGASSTISNEKEELFPFIYSEADDFAWFRSYIGNCSECVQGHLYVKNLTTGQIRELISQPVKQLCKTQDMLYCLSADGNEILRTSYFSKEPTTVYRAKAGNIDYMKSFENILYFAEGETIIRFDLNANQYNEISRCPGITSLYPVSEYEVAWTQLDDRTFLIDITSMQSVEADLDSLFPGDELDQLDECYYEENERSVLQETFPLSNYPIGSYFTKNGNACTDHALQQCLKNPNCNCIRYGNGVQCWAFARYAYDRYAHCSSWVELNSHKDENTVSINTEDNAEAYLKGLKKGTYLRLDNEHSIVVVSTSDTHITFYEANVGGQCLVGMRSLTYSTISNRYSSVTQKFEHSFDGLTTSYNNTYHKARCSLSGCSGYIYEEHYALYPGAHTTCLACGYVGYIENGIQSVGGSDE